MGWPPTYCIVEQKLEQNVLNYDYAVPSFSGKDPEPPSLSPLPSDDVPPTSPDSPPAPKPG